MSTPGNPDWYNRIMRAIKKLTATEAANYLDVTKTQVMRLIKRGKLKAELQNTPVAYYLIELASVEEYKNSPKNKGGRPRKE